MFLSIPCLLGPTCHRPHHCPWACLVSGTSTLLTQLSSHCHCPGLPGSSVTAQSHTEPTGTWDFSSRPARRHKLPESCLKLRNESNRNRGGLTLLDDGQGSEKQKWGKRLEVLFVKGQSCPGRGEGMMREGKTGPGLPGRGLVHSSCHTHGASNTEETYFSLWCSAMASSKAVRRK